MEKDQGDRDKARRRPHLVRPPEKNREQDHGAEQGGIEEEHRPPEIKGQIKGQAEETKDQAEEKDGPPQQIGDENVKANDVVGSENGQAETNRETKPRQPRTDAFDQLIHRRQSNA
jgi:hypothetical protein